MKFAYLLHLSIQLYSSDLNNLKGHVLHGAFFPLRALVPLQIKYNIIHVFILSNFLPIHSTILTQIWKEAIFSRKKEPHSCDS